jgi:hypothetical protein
MKRAVHVVSTALGICAALLSGVTVVFGLTDWLQHETYRLPPVSQPGYFFGLTIVALFGGAQAALALRSETGNRAAAMIAISGPLAVIGAIDSGGGRQTAVWLFYAGAVGTVAGLLALAEVPRRAWLGLVGLAGAVLLFRALSVLNQIVSTLFP